MTVEEFQKLLDSYHIESNKLSEQTIFEIGNAFKNTDKEGRNWKNKSSLTWDWLANKVGFESERNTNNIGEHYRKWVSWKCTHNDVKTQSLMGHEIVADSLEDFNNKIDDQVRRLYIQEKKTKDVNNSYRRTLTDEARIEALKDTIQETTHTLQQLPPIDFSGAIYPMSDKKEAILMLSDLHIGVECDNFYNKYNIEIARKRVAKVVEDTIHYCKLFGIGKLNIINLGDMIHGLIHINARLEEEVETVKQVMVASEIISEAINKLQEAAPIITYRSCLDNHSRAVADLNQHIEKDNLGRLIDWYLEERLKDTKVQFTHDNIDDGIGKFKLENGKNVVFVHGHLDNPNQIFQNMVGATKEFIDYALLAHYHCEKVKSFQGFKVFVNGSIVGTEQYALSKRLFSKPAQTLLIFDNEDLIDISINLENI